MTSSTWSEPRAPGSEPNSPSPRDPSPSGRPETVGSRHPLTISGDDVLLAILLGATAVAWWPMLVALRGPRPLHLVPLVAHVAGMLAGYGVVVLIALMARSPILERGVGADRLARWHASGGRMVVGLVVVHAWAAVASWAESHRENNVVATREVLSLPGLMFATIGTVVLLVVAAASVRAARRKLSYETWHALHLLTYVAVALAFVHELAGPDLAGYRIIQVGWALLYAQVFSMVLRHRILTPLRQAGRHRLRVIAVRTEGPGVVSLEIEGQHLDELEAESGQFFRWRFLTPDHWRTAHPFSLSAPPTNDRLRLTVKALGDGSSGLQRIEPGTWIVAEGPYGAMTARRRTRADVLLIAGGVGITPMRALFETLPLEQGQNLTLIYRARGPEHVVFRSELDAIAHWRGANVHYLIDDDPHCLTAPGLLHLVPDLAQRDVYLCGPPPMSVAVRAELARAGLALEHLHEERFAW
jgi:predicted ferric reductase